MQLKYLHIKEFRNLKNFKLNFDYSENNPLTVLLGKNGAGKSNLLEAILFIFRNLHYSDSLPIPFEYTIQFKIHGIEIKITASEKEKPKYLFEIDGQKRTGKEILEMSKTWMYEKQPEKLEGILPENVLVYYAGYSKRMEYYFEKTDEDYAKALRDNKYYGFRPLFYYKPIHYRFILLGLFASKLPALTEFLNEKLKIEKLTHFEIIIKRPDWARLKTDTHENFWRASGRVKIFFKFLQDNSAQVPRINDDTLIFSFDAKKLAALIPSSTIPTEIELVKLLDAADLGGFIKEINIYFRKEKVKSELEFSHLSEGEQQIIAIRGGVELLRDRESLFLMDEPDTFLHPDWQRDFMSYLNNDNTKDHYVMATHSPQALSMVHIKNVVIMQNGVNHSANSESFGKDTNSILEEILDIDKRPSHIRKLEQKYFDLLSQDKLEEAKEVRTKLEKDLSASDPIFFKADAILKRKEFLKKNEENN
ncbi:MAG: AAA family ATPase [Flavobacterium sp.]|jgi:predicted ATP-binding protein involved in virulence